MKRFSERQKDALAILLILLLAVAFLYKVVLTGGVFLPADLLLVMNPWRHYARALFSDFERAQNPLLDVIQQYYPWRLYAVRTLRGGEIPLWNPYAFCGTPFVANLQSAIFYPLNLIFFLTAVGRGFGFSALIHLCLAGTFTYLLLRHWKLQRPAALLGAVTFMFNGYFIAWMEFPSISLWTGTWLPLILLLFDKSIVQRNTRWAIAAGAIVGVQFLGGHLNTSFYVVFGLTAYAAFRAITKVQSRCLLVIGHWLLVIAVGFALSAIQLLPTFELSQRSTRSVAHQYHEVVVNGLPLHHLITFLVPNFFGNNKVGWWAGFKEVGTPLNFIETMGYVGVLPLAFALFGVAPLIARHRRNEWGYYKQYVYFFAGLALFSLLIAMGTPLYAVFFYLVPGFKQLAAPARILYLLDFCLAILAAFGAEQLALAGRQADNSERSHVPPSPRSHIGVLRFCVVFALIALATLVAAILEFPVFFFHKELYPYELVQVVWSVVFIGATVLVMGGQARKEGRRKAPWGMIAVGIAVADLFLFGIHFNPVCDARILDVTPSSVKYLRADRSPHRILSLAPSDDANGFLRWMPPNTPMMYELSDVQGSDSLVVKQYLDVLRAVQPNAPTHDFRNVNAPFINLLNVKYVLTEASLDPAQWEPVSNDDVTVYRNRRVLPRVFLVSRTRVKHNRDDLLNTLAQPGFRPEREVLLEEELPLEMKGEAQGEARLIRYRPNQAEMETRSAAPAVLVFSDTWYAGWRAAVDGKPQRILRANGTLRAVALTAGEHKIALAYHPMSFRLGAFWSLTGVACIVAVGGYGVIPRRATRGERWTKTSSISSRT